MKNPLKRIHARHLILIWNLMRVTFNPIRWVRGVKLAQIAMHSSAMQKLSEAAPFFAMLDKPRCVVEIGSGAGGMLAALAYAAAPDALLISIDLPGGPFGGWDLNEEKVRAYQRSGQRIEFLRDDSHLFTTLSKVQELTNGREVDVLFIDGDHTYDGVNCDYHMYGPLVKEGGIIVFHDILPAENFEGMGVREFWKRLVGKKTEIVSWREMNQYKGGTWGGIGVLHMAHKLD